LFHFLSSSACAYLFTERIISWLCLSVLLTYKVNWTLQAHVLIWLHPQRHVLFKSYIYNAGGVRDDALFHYPSCKYSIKPCLQFSFKFAVLGFRRISVYQIFTILNYQINIFYTYQDNVCYINNLQQKYQKDLIWW
jgi:hypothetical protein